MTDAKKPTIMVVDDEPINIRYIGEILESDYEILAFTSGENAIKYLNGADNLPDLILLDVVMPKMDGFEACEKLKAEPKTAKIPVIFITALIDEQDEEKGFLAGGVDYIKKPFAKTIAKSRINNHIKLKQYQDMLEQSSTLDELTQIPNRRFFNEAMARELLALRRYKGYLSCLIMDIDNFKAYNDHYGHISGDACLKTVAQCIKKSLMRKNDICARFGGEEFVVLLPGTNSDGAIAAAETIMLNLKNANIAHEFSLVSDRVTVSIGCSTTNELQLLDEKSFLELADNALYAAKKSGKNRVVCESTISSNEVSSKSVLDFPTIEKAYVKDIIKLPSSAIIKDALEIINAKNIRNIVVEDDKKYFVLSVSDIVYYAKHPDTLSQPLSSINLKPLPVANKKSSLFEVFVMFDKEYQIIGVVDDSEELLGIVTYKNLMNAAYGYDDDSLLKPISNLLSKEKIGSVSKEDLLSDKLSDLDISAADCLIAVDENGKPEGIITKRDIAKFIAKNISLEQPIKNLMHSPVFTTDKNCSINGAFYLMQDKNLKRMILVDENGVLFGAATQREILDAIYSKLAQKGFFKIEKLNSFISEHIEKKTRDLEIANKVLIEKLTDLERKYQSAKLNSLLRD